MNKLTKAAIAGAAGIALLLGGAGSLAYWNSSATIGASTINAGTLSIVAVGAATTTYDASGDPVTDGIVPGDTVNVTQDVTISATGDNLNATLTIDETGLVGTLKPFITTPLVVKVYDASDVLLAYDLSDLSGAEAANIASVSVTVVFPTTVTGTDGQGKSLDLGNLVIKLTQIP